MDWKVIGLAWPALNIWLLKNPEDKLGWIFEFTFFLSSSFSPYHIVGLTIQGLYLKLKSCPKQHIAQFVSCSFPKVFFYLKPQFKGMSSLSRTSLRLPLGQYSVTMATFGTSMQPPMNLQRLGWSSSLWKSTKITTHHQFSQMSLLLFVR